MNDFLRITCEEESKKKNNGYYQKSNKFLSKVKKIQCILSDDNLNPKLMSFEFELSFSVYYPIIAFDKLSNNNRTQGHNDAGLIVCYFPFH